MPVLVNSWAFVYTSILIIITVSSTLEIFSGLLLLFLITLELLTYKHFIRKDKICFRVEKINTMSYLHISS